MGCGRRGSREYGIGWWRAEVEGNAREETKKKRRTSGGHSQRELGYLSKMVVGQQQASAAKTQAAEGA